MSKEINEDKNSNVEEPTNSKVYCKNCIFLEEICDSDSEPTDNSISKYRCMNDACFSIADTPLETITVRVTDYEKLNKNNDCKFFLPNKKNFISSIFGR